MEKKNKQVISWEEHTDGNEKVRARNSCKRWRIFKDELMLMEVGLQDGQLLGWKLMRGDPWITDSVSPGPFATSSVLSGFTYFTAWVVSSIQ